MTEEEILSRKPYTDAPPELTPEDQADNLVNAFMHQLRCEADLVYLIDDWSDARKVQVHNRLFRIAILGLTKPDLLRPTEVPESVEAESIAVPPPAPIVAPSMPPAGAVVSVGISESDGFVVQPGGLLLSQQVKK